MNIDRPDAVISEWIVHPLVVAKYPKDDLIGMFFGYFSLLVYEIQAVYITLILWNRDMLTFYCCFTHLLSEIMNIILKKIIQQPRPANGAPKGGLFEGEFGWPSQHCHCFAYLFTMVLLLNFHYYRKHIGSSKKLLVVVVAAVGLTLQIVARVYLGFHTIEQCLAGVAFGTLSASMFYVIGVKFLLNPLASLCRLPPLSWLSFRKDSLPAPTSPRKLR